MLDLRRLSTLRSVAITGSVRRTADALGFAPSSVSQQLGELERHTGLQLTARAGRGILLTPDGEELVARLGPLFEAADAVERWVRTRRGRHEGSLAIRYISSVGATWIPAVVRRLHAEFPSSTLGLEVGDGPRPGDEPAVSVYAREAGHRAPHGFCAQAIETEQYAAVLPAGHRLAGADRISMADLDDENWVDADVPGSWCSNHLQRARAAAGVLARTVIHTPDTATAVGLVGAGQAVGILPERSVGQLPDDVRRVPLVDPPTRTVFAVVALDHAHRPLVARTVEVLAELPGD